MLLKQVKQSVLALHNQIVEIVSRHDDMQVFGKDLNKFSKIPKNLLLGYFKDLKQSTPPKNLFQF